MKDRELDILIAENIMGLDPDDADEGGTFWTHPKHYSTNIADAWDVVEKMLDKNILFEIYSPRGKDLWYVVIDGVRTIDEINTAPKAICMAALKAKGIEI